MIVRKGLGRSIPYPLYPLTSLYPVDDRCARKPALATPLCIIPASGTAQAATTPNLCAKSAAGKGA